MTKLMAFLGATILGWVGWWIGDRVGLFTAFLLSIVGTGLGIYLGRKLADRLGV